MAIQRRHHTERPAEQSGTTSVGALEGRTIIGIDPGTNVMGYAVIQIRKNKPHCVVLGVVNMGKYSDRYQKLRHIFERVGSIIEQYKPDEMALEAPFFGDNVQSMLKLGRAQGVAMTAALVRDLPVFEYAPTRIKQAITGQGGASKEQVSALLSSILGLGDKPRELDATDALAVAVCHYYIASSPIPTVDPYAPHRTTGGASSNWESYLNQNPSKIK